MTAVGYGTAQSRSLPWHPWLSPLKATVTYNIFSRSSSTVPCRKCIFQPVHPIFWKDQPIFVLDWGQAPEAVGGV